MSNLCNSSAIIIFLVIFNKIISIIQIIAPILAIIALARLLLKLVLNPEDKKAKKQIFNSLLALVLVFLVPFLVKLSVNIISESYLTAYCFEEEELSAIMESVFDEPKYIEIDSLQNRLNNVMEKLQKISDKCEEIKENINKYVLEEINSELLMYISKTDSN